jgi:hypothetical protein
MVPITAERASKDCRARRARHAPYSDTRYLRRFISNSDGDSIQGIAARSFRTIPY